MAISEKTFAKRKKQIIKAAEKLFIRNGFQEVSMDNIAKQADISKPTLYNYFGSKVDIYYVCLVTSYIHRWHKTKPKELADKTGFELVREYAQNLIEYGYNYPEHLLFTSNVSEQNFDVLLFHRNVSKSVVELYEPKFLEAKKAYSGLFEKGFADKTIKKKSEISIQIYFLYALRGYIIERVSALMKLKKKGRLVSQGKDGIDQLIELSRAELNFHLDNLLEMIKFEEVKNG
ncbi:MAG: TetR/AcrR family transcriptional regulator [Candidatus Cloacimonadales bacterium]